MIRKDEGELFIAENYFLLACRYGNRTSCVNHERLNEKRLEFESDMRRKQVKVEARCDDDIASACAELSFIASYFGQQDLSNDLDRKPVILVIQLLARDYLSLFMIKVIFCK